MKRRKMISFLAVVVLVLSITVAVFAQTITGSIREIHEITLNSDVLKVKTTGSFANYVLVTNESTITVDNPDGGYDLIVVSADGSDGKPLVYDRKNSTYTIPANTLDTSKTYYAVAVMHHEFNRYVSSSFDLELLNNEYRHVVVNDDMSIGNVTDLFNYEGDYIGDEKNYDLRNHLYDHKGNLVNSVLDVKTISNSGPISYEMSSISSSTVVNLNNFRRNDFYSSTAGVNGSRATGSITLTPSTKLYDAYGRLLKQIYYLEPVTSNGDVISYREWNYVFTKDTNDHDIIILNGNVLETNETIDLSHSYYEDGVVVEKSYNSSTFKNIYIINNIDINKDISLIMPCNIHMLNNDINLNANLEFKHYYHGNFIFDNQTINSHKGVFTSSDPAYKVSFVCPNATYSQSDLTAGFNTVKSTTLAEDTMEYILGYVYDRIIDEGFREADNEYLEGERYYTREGAGTYDSPYVYTRVEVDSSTFDPNIHYVQDAYSAFSYNPILPKTFYDENVKITYEENGEDFVVEREEENTKHTVLITIDDGVDVYKQIVKIWVVGTKKQAIVDSIAKEFEYRINEGFASNTSKMYFNYDSIEALFMDEDVSFETISGITASAVYQRIATPSALDNDIHVYVKNGNDYSLVTTSINQNEAYYAKYLLIQRASYSFSNNSRGILKVKLTYNDGEEKVVSQNISSTLPSIEVLKYQEYIINEIGQIYFTGDQDTYNLPRPEDLILYDVKAISYQPKMKLAADEYINVPELSVADYVMNNTGVSSVYEYFVEVTVTLNDDSQTTFLTPKIIISAASTGGDGANEYRSSLFQQEFNSMSIFIGKSDVFKLDGNMYFYLKIANPSGYESYIGLYRVIDSYEKSSSYATGDYFYIDDDLNKVYVTSVNDLDDPTDPNNPQRPLYTLPSDNDDVKANYKMVFLTDSDNITTVSNVINVKAYITDNSGFTSASELIAKSESASAINLYNGVYDANHNPIYEITNGKDKYVITYERDYVQQTYNVTSVTYTNSTGDEVLISDGTPIDISGFYCNGFVYSKAEEGQKLYIKNGIYKNKTIVGTNINSYKDGNLTFTLTYNEYGSSAYEQDGFVSVTTIADFSSDNTSYYDVSGNLITSSSYNLVNGLYDSNGATLKNVIVNNTSFSFRYNDDRTCAGYVVNHTVSNSNNFKIVNMSTNDDYYSKAGILIKSTTYDLDNGLYDDNHNPVTDATIDGMKYKLTYDANGDCTGMYATFYHRTDTQQTTFYDITGNVMTIYVQTYTFEVPGIYKPQHFNGYLNDSRVFEAVNLTGAELTTSHPESYDLYQTLIDIYGQYNGTYTDENEQVLKYPRGYKEINGKKYFLLVSALEDAEVLAEPLEDGGGVKTDNQGNIISLDCDGKQINLKTLELLPQIDKIYINNAVLAKENKLTWNFSNYSLGDITTNTEYASDENNSKKIKVYATDSNKLTIDGSPRTYDGISYTQRIKFNGSGQLSVSGGVVTASRAIEIPVFSGEDNLIRILVTSANSSDIREIAIAEASGNTVNILGYLIADMNNTTMESFVYTGSASSVFLYPTGGPINVYSIEVAQIDEFSINNSTLKNSLKDLELQAIKGLYYEKLDFSSYESLEKLIIKNSDISFMPKIYRKLSYLDLSNNKIKEIDNITSGVYLEYVNLTNNIIESFDPMRFMTTLKNLYVTGNNVIRGVRIDSNIIYPYGTPRIENNVRYGEINVSNFVQIFETNKFLTNQDNFDMYNFLYGDTSSAIYSGVKDYLEAAYIANSVSYMTEFKSGVTLDLGLVEKLAYIKNGEAAGSSYYVANAYFSKDNIDYDTIVGTTSSYKYNSVTFNSNFVTTDRDYKHAIFSISIQNDPSEPENTFTVYREIYFDIA